MITTTMMKNNTAVVPYDSRKNISNTNNNNDYNDGRLLLTMLPLPLLLLIVNIVGTQEDFVNISVLSKQFHMIVHSPAIDTRIIRVYEISPSKNGRGSERQLLQRLVHNRLHHNEKFSQYHSFRLHRINEFEYDVTTTKERNKIMINAPPFYNFESLDLSLPYLSSSTLPADARILYDMGNLLSTVQEIDLSCVRFDMDYEQLYFYLRHFFGFLSSRQKVTWHHCDRIVQLSGETFHPTKTQELVADDSIFLANEYSIEGMSNLEQQNNYFIFMRCESLECLSIRNTKYTDGIKSMVGGRDIPQNALIKFVRNAPPSMRWFRSDLTQENRAMLQQERPEIQLVN